jgi:hypothetical protein
MRSECLSHAIARQLAGNSQSQSEKLLILGVELFDEQVHRSVAAVAGPCENRAPRRFQFPRLGNIGPANLVVNLDRLGQTPLAHAALGAQDAPFGDGRAHVRFRARESLTQRLRRRVIADAAERDCSGRGHFRVVDAEQRRQVARRVGATAHADRIDRPHQQPAFERSSRLDQRRIDGRIGNRFQRDPRPGGELRIGKQFGQLGHALRGTMDRELLASERLLRRRRSAKRFDEIRLINCGNLGRHCQTSDREHRDKRDAAGDERCFIHDHAYE